MPTQVITASPTRLVAPNNRRTSLVINNISENTAAVGIIDNPTLGYSDKSIQINTGGNYSISLGSAVVGVDRFGEPIYDNQRWVTGGWWLISASGSQTVSYQEIYR
jgi:hypothetical protein